jgi:hypothetical protein
MAPLLLSFVRMVCWFWGFFPLCYYVVLTVVCGIHHLWISFGFALATAAVLVVWLVLNGVAIASASVLNHHRRVAASKQKSSFLIEDVEGTFAPCSATLPPPTDPQVGQLTADVLSGLDEGSVNDTNTAEARSDGPCAFENNDSEVDLSSIQESMMTKTQSNIDSASLASHTLDTGGRAGGVNPLAANGPANSGAVRGHRGLAVRAQQRQQPTVSGGDRAFSSVEDTSLTSPHEAERCPCEALSRAPAPAGETAAASLTTQPPLPTNQYHGRPATVKHVNPESFSPRCGPHDPHVTKARNTAGVTAATAAAPPSSSTRKAASHSVSLRTAFMMPLVSIYVTIALSLLVLVAAILFEYETHCLMLALPALTVPGLWSTLIPLRKFFDTHPGAAGGFHVRVLHFLTHLGSLTASAVVGLAVYIAAVALEVATWTPYFPKKVPVPKAIRVVSYLSPIPSFIIVIFLVLNSTLQSRSAAHRSAQRRARAGRCSTTGSAAAVVAPPPAPKGSCNAESRFGPLGGFTGTSNDPQPQQTAEHGMLVGVAPTSFASAQADMLDDTNSTLSSIVRSSMGSSVFIPPCSLASPSKPPINRNHIRVSRTSSNGSTGLHIAPSTTHISSLPQLKTVTMLYVAYRNIYDENDGPVTRSFYRQQQQGGMAANRSLQQTISANYEALIEAIEEAREVGSADANAYVLTANEDALCLVWGLIPFSSEPVLLAIEKARRIMEAFRSRPKPPPTSTNAQQELVAAVVSAPHSLVGFIGTGGIRSVHFFNPRQHEGGAQLLRRGVAMYRRLPSVQSSLGGSESTFSGILLNGRARNNTAGSILARPCGIKSLPPTSRAGAGTTTGGVGGSGERRPPIGMAAKATAVEHYPIMYEFLDYVQAKEEEWHLVVQRQERLGAKFGFLTEAMQLLQQGDSKGAREVLTNAVENTDSGHDADSVVLAQMMLEDLNRIASTPS